MSVSHEEEYQLLQTSRGKGEKGRQYEFKGFADIVADPE
jgi:hypothetical protein